MKTWPFFPLQTKLLAPKLTKNSQDFSDGKCCEFRLKAFRSQRLEVNDLRLTSGYCVQQGTKCSPCKVIARLLALAAGRVKTLDSIQSQSQPLKGKRLNFERERLGCRHSVNCKSDMTHKKCTTYCKTDTQILHSAGACICLSCCRAT